MAFAGLIFSGVFGLVNLLLILLVARRLRLLAVRIPQVRPRPWLAPGTAVPDFEVTTVDGEALALERLRGKPFVIGFFSTGCDPCREQVPLFAMYLAGEQAPELGIAVIVGSQDTEGFSEQLAGKAYLVHEPPGGPITRAFSTNAFPGLYHVDEEGIVTASGPGLGAILGTRQGMAVRQ